MNRTMSEKDCIFCRIIRGEQPADFTHRGERIVAFKDIRPSAPVHILIVPRKHIRSINDLAGEDESLIAEMILLAPDLAREAGIASSGYKLLFNVEKGGGQFVFHLHLHLFGGWQRK
nr:histidine triad nucleotide-binding protein [Desulfatiglans anilini]